MRFQKKKKKEKKEQYCNESFRKKNIQKVLDESIDIYGRFSVTRKILYFYSS